MSTQLFFPQPSYLPEVPLKRPISIRRLCDIAEVQCKASGPWTKRQIEIVPGKKIEITAEPGDWGAVRIEVPFGTSMRKRARLVLGVLAYGLHDLVAKQSIANQPWAKPSAPPGRPKTGQALSNAQRQKRFRARKVIAEVTPT